MVTDLDIASFIVEKKKASWSELERQFVGPTGYKRSPCPKCKSTHIIVDQDTREIVCGDCGFVVFSRHHIARQTLLNYIKGLMKEETIEKTINKETNKPVYQVTKNGQKMLSDLQNKLRIIEMIYSTTNLQETLKEALKSLEEKN
jgi:transcription initiation factor TFIIIB Brf1 subunit/transcription initiation factor TFIIB